MIERVFRSSRFLVLVAVTISAVSCVLLYGVSAKIIFNVAVDVLRDIPSTAVRGKSLAVGLLKLLDLLLIAITFHIIAVSLYRLFIHPISIEESKFLKALDIDTFHDLKVTLSQVAVVILVILFLEQAVEVGATLETLYFGAAIGIVISASVFAWKNMKP
ncbi:MAG: YqhA family protein [Moraxellaceae bacterium]|nr:YqhA family protein [Moraxellaceae bacterium]